MPYRKAAAAVLADWRAVESEIDAVKQGIADATLLHGELDRLHAEARRLRAEYQGLIEDAIGRYREVVPPFPEPTKP